MTGFDSIAMKQRIDTKPMAGQQFDYRFDDMGNRDTTGSRASTASDYTANRRNQYTTRTVPPYVDVLDIANPTADVTVNGVVAGDPVQSDRTGWAYSSSGQRSVAGQRGFVNRSRCFTRSGTLVLSRLFAGEEGGVRRLVNHPAQVKPQDVRDAQQRVEGGVAQVALHEADHGLRKTRLLRQDGHGQALAEPFLAQKLAHPGADSRAQLVLSHP